MLLLCNSLIIRNCVYCLIISHQCYVNFVHGLLSYSNHDDFDVSYDQLLSYCDIDRPEFTPCEVGYYSLVTVQE